MKGKLFKNALFGLQKESVYTYFEKLNKKMAQEMEEKNAIIADLRAQLQKRAVPVQTEVPDDIIEDARVRAEIIIQNAQNSLLASKEKLKKEIKEEKIKLRLLQAEVAGLKKNAVEATAKFTIDLDPLLCDEE